MRPTLSLLSLLLTAAAFAQDSQPLGGAFRKSFDQRALEGISFTAPKDSLLQAQRALAERAKNGDLCYTIRSYHFSREDGNAPVFDKLTTCAPSSSVATKKVHREAPVRLIPAVR